MVFCLMLLHRPRSTLFPYTTLFRSAGEVQVALVVRGDGHDRAGAVVGQHVVRRPDLDLLDHGRARARRSEEHTSELQSQFHLVCRLLLEKKKKPASYREASHTSSSS